MNAAEAADRFYGSVYRFVYRMLQERECAEDITQEAFLRLSADGGGRDAEATQRWLFTVARNLCMDDFRRTAVRARLGQTALAEQPVSERCTPTRNAEASELGECIAKLVAELEPEFREVVVLRDYEGLRYAEIAAILGCAEGTVKSRLARARERLRIGLKPYWESNR